MRQCHVPPRPKRVSQQCQGYMRPSIHAKRSGRTIIVASSCLGCEPVLSSCHDYGSFSPAQFRKYDSAKLHCFKLLHSLPSWALFDGMILGRLFGTICRVLECAHLNVVFDTFALVWHQSGTPLILAKFRIYS